MFQPDTATSRQLAREHQARLARDWGLASPARHRVVESRRRHGRRRLSWLLPLHRPASQTP
jgi:hypothetical protein